LNKLSVKGDMVTRLFISSFSLNNFSMDTVRLETVYGQIFGELFIINNYLVYSYSPPLEIRGVTEGGIKMRIEGGIERRIEGVTVEG
jgi:hypothetical protein